MFCALRNVLRYFRPDKIPLLEQLVKSRFVEVVEAFSELIYVKHIWCESLCADPHAVFGVVCVEFKLRKAYTKQERKSLDPTLVLFWNI